MHKKKRASRHSPGVVAVTPTARCFDAAAQRSATAQRSRLSNVPFERFLPLTFPPTLMQLTVFIVSDDTEIHCRNLRAFDPLQFDQKFRLVRVPLVDSTKKAYATLEKINEAVQQDGRRPIVFTTLVDSASKSDRQGGRTRSCSSSVPDLRRAARNRKLEAEVEPRDGARTPERGHRGVQEPHRGDQLLARARRRPVRGTISPTRT